MSQSQVLAIQPAHRFAACLRPPGSKSLTNRALLLAALATGKSRLSNVLFADDTRVMIEALRQLGFQLAVNDQTQVVTVAGRGGAIPNDHADLFLGNAGTAMRFLTAACCLGSGRYRLDGVPRMRQRPIGQLVDQLGRIGAQIDYLDEPRFPPLLVNAHGLRGAELTMQPTLSSQYISALLQVGAHCRHGLQIVFDGPVTSLPYIKMTVRLMQRFGIVVGTDAAFKRVVVEPMKYEAVDYRIEPDASNASYFLAAAAISPGSRCTIEGLGRKSLQGDVHFAQVLEKMGAEVEFTDEYICVSGPSQLRGIDVDLNDMPDMAQTLAVVALFAEGPTTMRNVGNLRVKETDRLAALHDELAKLGAHAHIEGDNLRVSIDSPGRLRPADIDTYDDHRMAMSFAVAGLRSEGVRIKDPACVNKTFPQFWHFLDRLRSGEG